MNKIIQKRKTSNLILFSIILFILTSQVYSLYYTYTKGNEVLYNLYFDPSNHLGMFYNPFLVIKKKCQYRG